MDETEERLNRCQLHFAANRGDLPIIRSLLANGHDVNCFDDIGQTPLHYAVRSRHLEIAKCIIEAGADVNAHYEPLAGNTPLREVAENCDYEMAKLLIDAGADPSIPGGMGITALQKAANRKRGDGPKVYQLLLDAVTKANRNRT